jgi:hypothetical protein
MDYDVVEDDVAKRLACQALGQHRSTQRKKPIRPNDEAILTSVSTPTPAWKKSLLACSAFLQSRGPPEIRIKLSHYLDRFMEAFQLLGCL